MKNNQFFLQNNIIKKDNDIIRTKVTSLSVEASKILATLIAQINTEEEDFKDFYTINVTDFLSNTSGRSYSRMKDYCQELLKATAEIELKMDYNGQYEYHGFTFFTHIYYGNGKINASFNFMMKYYLLQLKKHFTEINLIEYLQLSSNYSQRLFEILKSWSSLPEYIIQLDELHRMLNTVETQKKHFGLFRKRILEPCNEEINRKTDLSYKWESIKKGSGKTSPIVAIRFIFSKNQELSIVEKKKKIEIENNTNINNISDEDLTKINACVKEKNNFCESRTNDINLCKLCLDNRIVGCHLF